jgi:hypothetical protein
MHVAKSIIKLIPDKKPESDLLWPSSNDRWCSTVDLVESIAGLGFMSSLSSAGSWDGAMGALGALGGMGGSLQGLLNGLTEPDSELRGSGQARQAQK